MAEKFLRNGRKIMMSFEPETKKEMISSQIKPNKAIELMVNIISLFVNHIKY
jgi:hypothetical protein